MASSRLLVQLAYAYLVLPVFIFITSWCNLPTALIGIVILCTSMYFMCQNAPSLWIASSPKEKRLLGMVAIISLVWTCLSGIGAIMFQNLDHNCRNPIFEILVQAPWPVILENPPAILTYYIGFWLPSAAIGKAFHSIQLGYYCQVLWASMGIFLCFYLILAACKRKNYIPVFLFILFSGLDVLGCWVTGNRLLIYNPISHMEWWYPYFQFSSFTTQLFWVFNQALPAWLAVLLMYHEQNNKNLLFLYACTFLHSTLPAIGLFPFVVYWYVKNKLPFTTWNIYFKNMCNRIWSGLSFQNLAGALFIVVVSFAYLSQNISGGQPGTGAFSPLFHIHIIHWLCCFWLPEVGLYLLLIWKIQKKNPLYYLLLMCFWVYPFLWVGSGPDFCMRATLPALVILYLLIIQSLQEPSFRKRCAWQFWALIITLGLGSITPLHEIARTVYFTYQGVTKVEPDLSFNNFFGWTEGNVFLTYFGKNVKN